MSGSQGAVARQLGAWRGREGRGGEREEEGLQAGLGEGFSDWIGLPGPSSALVCFIPPGLQPAAHGPYPVAPSLLL